jgi:hypothetical protein
VVAGGATALLGSASLPSSGEVTASIESELRFYSVWWIGAGLFLAWLAPRVAERTLELRVFCALLFFAGLTRLLAISDAGWPHASQLVLMAFEFVLPVILVIWQARVTGDARSTEKAAG